MPLFRRNVALGPALRVSSWRKVAIGTWSRAGDPSVYTSGDIPAEPILAWIEKARAESGRRITLTHFFGKAVAETIRRHPDINCVLRFGRLYPRKHVDIFFQVASDETGEDLSGTTIRDIDQKSVIEIATEMEERVKAIRTRTDKTFKQVKATMGLLPGFLARPMLGLTGLITYTLNLWSPLLGTPRDPFGSAMITNIGSLGLETAFAPLVPYSRVPLVLVLGGVMDVPVVRDGTVVPGKVIRITATIDHRLIDGVHGALMSRTLKAILANPEKELGA